jgi:hypothetical protein
MSTKMMLSPTVASLVEGSSSELEFAGRTLIVGQYK